VLQAVKTNLMTSFSKRTDETHVQRVTVEYEVPVRFYTVLFLNIEKGIYALLPLYGFNIVC